MKQSWKSLTFLLLCAPLAFGQGAFIPPQTALKVVNGYTTPIAGATITVCAANTSGIPCSPALVGTIFKDAALTQPLSNPFTSDAFGNFQFAAAPGTYTVTTTASGFAGYSSQIMAGAASSSPASYTVATLPSASGNTGTTVVVTDASTQGSCTVGGGTALAFCRSNGITWQPLGDGVGTSGGGSSIPTTNLLGWYKFNDGSGTTLSDSSGNGNNGTFCSAGAAPTWYGDAQNAPVGVQFYAGQCITLPSALNAARTIVLVTAFDPVNGSTSFVSPLCGNATTANDWGAFWANQSNGFTFTAPPMFSGANMYSIGAWSSNAQFNSLASPQGTVISAYTLGSASDSTFDKLYVNNTVAPFNPLVPSLYGNAAFTSRGAGRQTAGTYQFGGCPAGTLVAGFATWFPGQIYYALFYSDYKQPSVMDQIFNGVNTALAQKGVIPNHYIASTTANNVTGTANQYVMVGDSITFGTNVLLPFSSYMNLTSGGAWQWVDLGLPSIQATQQVGDAYSFVSDGFFGPSSAQNVATYWLGTNDITNGLQTAQQAYGRSYAVIRQNRYHSVGAQNNKAILVSMLSRTAVDASKNTLNTLYRQTWQTVADAFADVAADPCIGADGAFGNTTCMQVDAIHPTPDGLANHVAPIVQRAINRLYGNNSWTSATTYTTAATAPVATTAGSESGNTITITFGATPANCQVGNTITIAGTTPSTYSADWQILTRTATQVTFISQTSGLGAITVQGTGVCPQQQDADVYTILGGSAAGNPSFTLEECLGYTGQNLYFKNTNTTSAWVLTPFHTSETIDGATSLTMPTASSGNFPVVVLQAQLVSASAGGCTWKRLQ